LGKFVSFSIEVEDSRGKLLTLNISNSNSVVRLGLDAASLPLELDTDSTSSSSPAMPSKWNKLQLDLAKMVSVAFSAKYVQTHRITFFASCRIRRVFFSESIYPDFALPPSLRIGVGTMNGADLAATKDQQRQATAQMQAVR